MAAMMRIGALSQVWCLNIEKSSGHCGMNFSRRQFLILTAGFVAGCSSVESGKNSAAGRERMINAGPAGDYAADGVYSRFRDEGFFVIRKGEKLFALSAFCTHRKCKLMAESDRSFYCKCHGSTFDSGGKVTKGPAKLDLPMLPAFPDENGQLLVKVPLI
jgi:nitrite reductase/ring-hydroxylating ferredoxin subunit